MAVYQPAPGSPPSKAVYIFCPSGAGSHTCLHETPEQTPGWGSAETSACMCLQVRASIPAAVDLGHEGDTADDKKGGSWRSRSHSFDACKTSPGDKGAKSRWCLLRRKALNIALGLLTAWLRHPQVPTTSPGDTQRQSWKILTAPDCTYSRATIPAVIPFVTPSLFTLLSRMLPITGGGLFQGHCHLALCSFLLRVSWSFRHCQRCEMPLTLPSDWQWSVTPLALNFCSVC